MAAQIVLASRGVQDSVLTSTPDVSFFRQAYRKYTNFCVKPERLDYIGQFRANTEVVVPIKSKGDLLSTIWIEGSSIGAVGDNTTGLFSADSAPTEFSLWIGGQKVVTMDSLYVQAVHNVLYRTDSAKASCSISTNDVKGNAIGAGGSNADHYVIPFFFSEDWSKALPLLAMQHVEVEVRIKCRPGLTRTDTPKIYANFIFVDTEEREFFTKNEHAILIDQVQTQLCANTDTEVDLSYFNHPCRAIHMASANASAQNWSSEYTFDTATMYINGSPLFENMSANYHHTIVPELHCTHLPDTVLDNVPVFTWPFQVALNRGQMTGSLNFSRIDTAKLSISGPSGGNAVHRVYAPCMNILRIKGGQAGVAYGN